MPGMLPVKKGEGFAALICLLAFLLIMTVSAAWGLQMLDDGYYYLQVAWNLSRGQGSSFDGIHPTNGYHPLWQFMLVPLHWMAPKESAVWLAAGLQALLFSASGVLVYRILRRLEAGELISLTACGFWVMNFWLWGKGAMSGMETGLLLLLFGLSLDRLLRTVERGDGGLGLGFLLAMACAARLDSVALTASVFILLLSLGMRKPAFRSLMPTAGYLALYLPANLMIFGGATPVSGYVKSEAGRMMLTRFLRHGDTAFFGHALGNLGELVTLGGRMPLALSLVLACGAGVMLTMIYIRGSRPLRALLLTVVVYGALLVGFYSFMYPSLLGAYTYYWIPLLYGATALGFASLAMAPAIWRRSLPVLALAFLVIFDFVYARDRLGSYSFAVVGEERPDCRGAAFLNSLEGEVVVGSWDAGYLGYNCIHPVVNLDGLVAGYDYQRALREEGLARWIEDQGITHLANTDYFSGKRRFIEEDLGWLPVFEDTAAMPRPVSLFSLSPGDLDYASRELRIFFVYARP